MTILFRFFLIGATSLSLASCDAASTESRFGESGPFTVQTASGPVKYRSTNDYVFQKVKQSASSASALRAFLMNTTSQEFEAGTHGTQIEYLGPGGVTYLWYPGNTIPLKGQWQVQDGTNYPSICFRYGENTYNPVTGQGGGGWECGPGPAYLFEKLSVVQGDVFNLASGRLPFILPGGNLGTFENVTMTEAFAKAGLSTNRKNKADWGAMMRADIAASNSVSP
jgi:hypothetical protein